MLLSNCDDGLLVQHVDREQMDIRSVSAACYESIPDLGPEVPHQLRPYNCLR